MNRSSACARPNAGHYFAGVSVTSVASNADFSFRGLVFSAHGHNNHNLPRTFGVYQFFEGSYARAQSRVVRRKNIGKYEKAIAFQDLPPIVLK